MVLLLERDTRGSSPKPRLGIKIEVFPFMPSMFPRHSVKRGYCVFATLAIAPSYLLLVRLQMVS